MVMVEVALVGVRMGVAMGMAAVGVAVPEEFVRRRGVERDGLGSRGGSVWIWIGWLARRCLVVV